MYYIIDNALDDKIVGKAYPQVDCETMAQAHLIDSWHLWDPKPKLNFTLKRNAILTDVLKDATISSRGFLINEKVKEILKLFHIMQHQFFHAPVRAKGKIHDYYWWHLCEPELTHHLDYEKSVFYRTEYEFREEPITLTSYQHYETLKKQDAEASFGVEIETIALAKTFDRTLDAFTFLPLDGHIYISENLKQALEQNDVTGLKIEKALNFL